MANLTRKQLSQAEKYITSYGRGRNSISVLMELGQLFHISPEFNSHEPQHSTVHLHVFICTVNFANYIEEAEGHNKKRVKADAAKKMLDRLLHEARSVVFRGDERMETTRISSNLVRAFLRPYLCKVLPVPLIHRRRNRGAEGARTPTFHNLLDKVPLCSLKCCQFLLMRMPLNTCIPHFLNDFYVPALISSNIISKVTKRRGYSFSTSLIFKGPSYKKFD